MTRLASTTTWPSAWLGLAAVLTAHPSSAETYYVDSSCPDTHPDDATVDGTTYDATATPPTCTGGTSAYHVTVADLASKAFVPGDVISFRRGQAWTPAAEWRLADSGTAAAPIIITAHGAGVRPVLDRNHGADSVLNLTGGHVIIEHLSLKHSTGAVLRMFDTTGHVVVDDCELSGSTESHGLNWGDAPDLLLTRSVIHDNGATGHDHGVYIDNVTGATENVVIEYCDMFGNGSEAIKINHYPGAGRIPGIVVRYNRLHQISNSGNAIGDYGSTAIQVYGNLIYSDNPSHDAPLYNCTTDDDEAPTDGRLYNNTFYFAPVTGHGAIQFAHDDCDGFELRNNVIQVTGGGFFLRATAPGATLAASDWNQLFGDTPQWLYNTTTYSSLADWRAATGFDVHSDASDPSLEDPAAGRLTLAADSPCIDSGEDLGDDLRYGVDPASVWTESVVARDQDAFGLGWERGAYVYGSGDTGGHGAAGGGASGGSAGSGGGGDGGGHGVAGDGPPDDDGGCGCRLASTGERGLLTFVMLTLGSGIATRRRRARAKHRP